MYPSAELCRAQEILQRERAASATLDNVRAIAEAAADAWAVEALRAEEREQRYDQTRLAARARTSEKQKLRARKEELAGAPPDRGTATG
jgi:hypothetical protein